MENQKFVLKKGRIVHSQTAHQPFGVANMTDEVALKLLKESHQNIQHFEKFPEDWKDLCAGVKPLPSIVAQKEKEQSKKDEALLKDLLLSDVAQLQSKADSLMINQTEWFDIKDDKKAMVALIYKALTGKTYTAKAKKPETPKAEDKGTVVTGNFTGVSENAPGENAGAEKENAPEDKTPGENAPADTKAAKEPKTAPAKTEKPKADTNKNSAKGNSKKK